MLLVFRQYIHLRRNDSVLFNESAAVFVSVVLKRPVYKRRIGQVRL